MSKKIVGGYYIKARQIKNSWIANAAPVVREVWDYLLREANHKDKKHMGFIIKRGQLFRSYQDIRDDLSWNVGYRKQCYSENQMKHCMKLLRTQLMVELMSQPRGNLITILNYDIYQDPKNYESTDESTDESTINQPSINQSSLPINKNDKNVKNDKNNVFSNENTPVPETPELSFEPSENCPQKEIIQIYHSILPELSQVKVWNETSRKNLRARWKESSERQTAEWWESFFTNYIRESDFLMGRVKDFQADLGWIVGPKNFQKIMNGFYKNRGPRTGSRLGDSNARVCEEFIADALSN